MFAAREQAGSLGTQIHARHCRPFFASASFTISVVIYFCIVEVSLEPRIGGKKGKKSTERYTYKTKQAYREARPQQKASAISVTVLPSLGKK